LTDRARVDPGNQLLPPIEVLAERGLPLPVVVRVRAATVRCTTGSTTRSTGNATTHEVPQALNHAGTAPGSRPMFLAVDTPETMQDMMSDVKRSAKKLP
jgi:hypothetical protein